MTNNVNTIPALHLYVSFVTISMLMCYLAFGTHCSLTELLAWQQTLKWICLHYQEMLETTDKVCRSNHKRKIKNFFFQDTVCDRVWTVECIFIGGASHCWMCWFRLSSWVCLEQQLTGLLWTCFVLTVVTERTVVLCHKKHNECTCVCCLCPGYKPDSERN